MKIVLSSISLETATDFQLALYYLKSYLLEHCRIPLRKRDISICVFNETQSAESIARRILREHPVCAGFSCYLWNIALTLEVCRLLKRAQPKVCIVLGGPEVSPRAGALLESEPAVDYIVRGEGEVTFCRLLEALSGAPDPGRTEQKLQRVQGITFRRAGAVVDTRVRPNIRRLQDIPSPYLRGLVDLQDRSIVDLPLETTRGCSFRCGYCYYHKSFPRLRFFPLARVEAELKLILSARPSEVYLMDATFNADPARAMKILALFRKYNRGSSLHLELMAELVDEPMAAALAEANASNIEIGLQSSSLRTLRAVNRPFNKERFAGGIALLNRYNLVYEIQLIDALPLQRYQDILDALDWLYGLHPSRVDIFSLSVLPGTALARQCKRYGIECAQEPPYRARASAALSAEDLQRVRRLRFALDRLYDSGVFRTTLYALKHQAGIKISAVLEDWVQWEKRIRSRSRDAQRSAEYPQLLNRRLPEFLGFVLRRHGKMPLRKRLAEGLSLELSEYRKAYGA